MFRGVHVSEWRCRPTVLSRCAERTLRPRADRRYGRDREPLWVRVAARLPVGVRRLDEGSIEGQCGRPGGAGVGRAHRRLRHRVRAVRSGASRRSSTASRSTCRGPRSSSASALIGLGVYMLTGRQLIVNIPKLQRGGADGTLVSMYLFGVSYAVASLSCTIGAVPRGDLDHVPQRRATCRAWRSSWCTASGMGVVVSVLTLAVALAKDGIVDEVPVDVAEDEPDRRRAAADRRRLRRLLRLLRGEGVRSGARTSRIRSSTGRSRSSSGCRSGCPRLPKPLGTRSAPR